MIKNKKDFKILLIYPNLPLMLVPPLSMAIFTKILKEKKHEVELFDTTPYIPEDVNSSPQNRTIYLQARQFSDEDDLGVSIKTNLLGEQFKLLGRVKRNEMFDRLEFNVQMVEKAKAEEEIKELEK